MLVFLTHFILSQHFLNRFTKCLMNKLEKKWLSAVYEPLLVSNCQHFHYLWTEFKSIHIINLTWKIQRISNNPATNDHWNWVNRFTWLDITIDCLVWQGHWQASCRFVWIRIVSYSQPTRSVSNTKYIDFCQSRVNINRKGSDVLVIIKWVLINSHFSNFHIGYFFRSHNRMC